MARHGRSNALQIVALSLGGVALLLLTFVRADLMESWRGRLPPDAPNRFLVNIQPDQRDALKSTPWRDFFVGVCTNATMPEAVAEAALAHVVPDQVVRAYQRAKFIEMRRKLLDAWGDFCTGHSNVLSLVG